MTKMDRQLGHSLSLGLHWSDTKSPFSRVGAYSERKMLRVEFSLRVERKMYAFGCLYNV